ncbi:MAG TPA: beta galactosidase jelly roll domain-containing protein [Ignavibacteriaceae bacterium]|nr:beta galactosidase jelly roll domain-containing protein [Ignavibacteriaceae bacterium]
MYIIFKHILAFLFILFFLIAGCRSQKIEFNNRNNKNTIDLKGKWKFSIGDDISWINKNYDDNNWEEIKVPSRWEDQGFNGYDGYAWYRVHFEYNRAMKDKFLYLNLGRVDDVDQTFLNGHLIGLMGSFPPNFQTAYYVSRRYYLPSEFLNSIGDNVIAVRIFDYQLSGGILEGDPGLEYVEKDNSLSLILSGIWKFSTGDNSNYAKADFDDSKWNEITVPSFWELQGYQDYDGYGWYRKKFTIPENLAQKDLMLYLGKIDDIDQAYINGILIGSTGDFSKHPVEFNRYNEYLRVRAYDIPSGVLKKSGENTIAVRVYDGFRDGGIYEGPVGIIEKDKYTSFWRYRNSDK